MIESIDCGVILIDFLDTDGNVLDLTKIPFLSYDSEERKILVQSFSVADAGDYLYQI